MYSIVEHLIEIGSSVRDERLNTPPHSPVDESSETADIIASLPLCLYQNATAKRLEPIKKVDEGTC